MTLYLDIETIPSQSAEVRDRIAATIAPPGNMKKPETIGAWVKEQKPAVVDEAVKKTALDGAFGHIFCICWAIDDGEIHGDCIGANIGREADMIGSLFADLASGFPPMCTMPIVGHNVATFDIRFIWQRAMILGVRLPGWFPRDPRPWDNDVFDTMTVFAGTRGAISLDNLCRAFGRPGKNDIDGSMVADLWAKGEYDRIVSYCKDDVERVRWLHRKMEAALGAAA